MNKWFMQQFTRLQVYVYRRSGGRWMATMRGMPLLIMITVGKKSGKKRETPVMYLRHGANYVVTASNAGSDSNPGWYVNLRAQPTATLEVSGNTLQATWRVAAGEERALIWAELVSKAPFFDDYRSKTTREIPIVILTPVDNGNVK